MVVGVRQAHLKVLETADLLSFPTTSISEVYREWSKKEKNIQRVPVLWVKISFWCQALEENGKIVTEKTTLQPRYAEGHLWTHITLSLGLQQHKTIPGISAVYDVTDPRVEKECLKKLEKVDVATVTPPTGLSSHVLKPQAECFHCCQLGVLKPGVASEGWIWLWRCRSWVHPG